MFIPVRLQLVCVVLSLSILHEARGQATSTATDYGIVSAAGGLVASQTVAYSIEGVGVVAATSVKSVHAISHASGVSTSTDTAVLYGSDLTNGRGHGLSPPAILGIVVGVLLALIGITIFTICIHKRNQLANSRARRKSIMDAEFAAPEPGLPRARTETAIFDKPQVGYFDMAKPLPAVLPPTPVEDDTLSRSSTIIADAAEVAQLNRKVSVHQTRAKEAREQIRERNHALQILITNADNRTSVLHSPLSSNPTTPTEPDSGLSTKPSCTDGDGDAFAHRPSKL